MVVVGASVMFQSNNFVPPISLVLKGHSSFETDPWATSTDSATLLANFRAWGVATQDQKPRYDVHHLFTGQILDNGVIGRAMVGDPCREPIGSYGLERTVDLCDGCIIQLLAHEIGHNLGMRHDGSAGLGSICPASGFVMAPSLSGLTPTFSQCSHAYYQDEVLSSDVRCLHDVDVDGGGGGGGGGGEPSSSPSPDANPVDPEPPTPTPTPTPPSVDFGSQDDYISCG
jgi:hypothetical protein